MGAAVDSVVGSYKPDMPPSWLHGGISREQAEGEVHTLNGAECMREASDSPDDSVTNQIRVKRSCWLMSQLLIMHTADCCGCGCPGRPSPSHAPVVIPSFDAQTTLAMHAEVSVCDTVCVHYVQPHAWRSVRNRAWLITPKQLINNPSVGFK